MKPCQLSFLFVGVLTTGLSWAGPPTLDPTPARIDVESQLTGDALREFRAGMRQCAIGDANARTHFDAAYRLTRDARLFWAMSACAFKAHRYAEARRLLLRFRDEVPPGTHRPEAMRDIEDKFKALEAYVARVQIVVNQPGATLTLETGLLKDALGSSPLAAPVEIDEGVHMLVTSKDGFKTDSRVLTAKGGEASSVGIELQPVRHVGRLVLHVSPSTAVVRIDQRIASPGSFDGQLASGAHRIEVSAKGMRPWKADVVIADDQTREMTASLESDSGVAWGWWLAGGLVVAAGVAIGVAVAASGTDVTTASGSLGSVTTPLRF